MTEQERKEAKRLKRLDKIKETAQNATNSDKQRFITYLAYFSIIAVSIFSSCLSVIFGLEQFNFTRFITNLCFNVAIAIVGLILAWRDGELSNETRKRGLLYETRQLFKKIVKLIIDADSFRQWNDLLFEKERKEYILTELSKVQIYEWEYMRISLDDLSDLRKAPKENIEYYDENGIKQLCVLDEITDIQYYTILKYRKGKFKFEKLPYTFFKSKLGANMYKKYADELDKERKIKIWALTYRVLVVVIFSTIFALAIINPNDSDSNQVLFDTISRISNLVISLFMGYTLAHDKANREIECLEYKIEIIQQYDDELQCGLFVPKNRNQILMEKIASLREKKVAENEITTKTINNTTPTENVAETGEIEIEMTQEEYDSMFGGSDEKEKEP